MPPVFVVLQLLTKLPSVIVLLFAVALPPPLVAVTLQTILAPASASTKTYVDEVAETIFDPSLVH